MSNLPDVLPILPVFNKVLFPGLIVKLHIAAEPKGKKNAPNVANGSPMINYLFESFKNSPNQVTLACTPISVNNVSPSNSPDYYNELNLEKLQTELKNNLVCTAKIMSITPSTLIKDGFLLVLEGVSRAQVTRVISNKPDLPKVSLQYLKEQDLNALQTEDKVLYAHLKTLAREIITNLKELRLPLLVANQLKQLIDNTSPGLLCDLLVTLLDLKFQNQMTIFNSINLHERLKLTIEFVKAELQVLKNKARESTYKKSTAIGRIKSNRPKHWSEQAEGDDDNDLADLKNKFSKIELPEEVKSIVDKEMKRLKAMQPSMADYQVIRNYLETLSDIPWNISSPEEIDISKAKQQLDTDHFGMDKIKKRILEYLSVCKLRKDMKGPIICLAGPPGVGKTSLGKSIANALGRKFHRISLGGIRDEAEIRGHRRTYVGAMPGVIIQGLKKCGVNNPVFLLDEVDKLCNGSHQGDPAAALLEVLDPEQNNTFVDHYINTPVDLSKILFIATANDLGKMSAPLLDRMEVVELSGYTINEKRHIAKNHLLPKQVQTHGLTGDLIEVPDDTLGVVISRYTREAGVRNLERTIAALCRSKAMDYSQTNDGDKYDKIIHIDDLENILGIARFQERLADQKLLPGMAIGMVYSQSGSGAIMFLEASKMPGSGKLVLTGKLGEVLKESAQIALSWTKSNAFHLGLTANPSVNLLENMDIHIHLPEGATPKDGPSAGIALVSALVSLFSQVSLPSYLSMTGEVSLRGKVLPVGGIREKVISAHRAGIKTIILPQLNQKDVNHQDLPDEVFQDIQFYFVSHITEVLDILFQKKFRSKLELLSRL